jgi:hypothetical protein
VLCPEDQGHNNVGGTRKYMTSKSVGNVIISLALLILLTGSVSADVVQVGSSIDATLTSFTTHLDARVVGADQDSPPVINYEISAKGITRPDGTTVPMSGSAVAYIRAHITGGRSGYGGTSQDLTYSDITKVSGLISSFQKSIAYKGGSYLI